MSLKLQPISSFKFRGSKVSIEWEQQDNLRDRYVDLTTMRADVAAINKLLGKHYRRGEYTRTDLERKCSLNKDAFKHGRYWVSVEMGRHRKSFFTSKLSRETRFKILQERRYIIGTLREDRKYSQIQEQSYSFSEMLNTDIQGSLKVYGTHDVGFVHAIPGQILKIQSARKTKRIFEAVKPMTSERHVGIEIECGIKISREDLGLKLIDFAGYVMIKGDGSVNVPHTNSVELNICAPISMYKDILTKVTNILNSEEVGAKVNKTCGLHIHLDVREYQNDWTKLNDKYERLISAQPILYSMQPKSRQSNTYCVKSKTRTISRGTSRYQGINAQAIWKYRTIEVRLHAGTTDYHKIANWIDMLYGIMYSNVEIPKRALSSVRSFFRVFRDVPISLLEYVVERRRKFEDDYAQEDETSMAV